MKAATVILTTVAFVYSDGPAPSGGGSSNVSRTRSAPVSTLHMSSPRATHAHVALGDGRIALIGGCAQNGCDEGPGSATVDVFDATTGRIQKVGSLLQARIGPAAVALSDTEILVVGGWSEGSPTASAEIFNVETRRSRLIEPMSTPRATFTVAKLADGRVLIAGGFDGECELASAEVFDPKSEGFSKVGALNQARSNALLTRLSDGRVLVTGGSVNRIVTATAEIFDPNSGRFTKTGAMLEPRYKHAAVALDDGKALIIAGSDERDYEGKKSSVEIYDPATQRFTSAGSLRFKRFKIRDAVTLLSDGRVLIAGGARKPEIFDPRTRTSTEINIDLDASWSYMTADALPGDLTLLSGGYIERSIEVTSRAWVIKLPDIAT